MQIGELARRAETSPRLLRYYEEQGLISSARRSNGYRAYREETVARVAKIRSLLDAGLTTELIREILPCVQGEASIYPPRPDEAMLDRLRQHRDRLASRARCLRESHEAIDRYLSAVSERVPAAAHDGTPAPSGPGVREATKYSVAACDVA